jgi:hypothetical protein
MRDAARQTQMKNWPQLILAAGLFFGGAMFVALGANDANALLMMIAVLLLGAVGAGLLGIVRQV